MSAMRSAECGCLPALAVGDGRTCRLTKPHARRNGGYLAARNLVSSASRGLDAVVHVAALSHDPVGPDMAYTTGVPDEKMRRVSPIA